MDVLLHSEMVVKEVVTDGHTEIAALFSKLLYGGKKKSLSSNKACDVKLLKQVFTSVEKCLRDALYSGVQTLQTLNKV